MVYFKKKKKIISYTPTADLFYFYFFLQENGNEATDRRILLDGT